MKEEKIRIRTEVSTEEKAALPRLGRATSKVVEVGIDALSDNLRNFLEKLQQILDKLPESKSAYYIDEVELSLVVNANGGFELIGKLEAGAKGGIKVKLKKRKTKRTSE